MANDSVYCTIQESAFYKSISTNKGATALGVFYKMDV